MNLSTMDIAPSSAMNSLARDSLVLQAVNRHLDILRLAITNYSGTVDVVAIDGEDCLVKYDGPESIGSGIKAAIKEKFPDIPNVVFNQ
jgi:NFU1 iron-sulfur cluster scaffold homolog, mitochondrial